LVDAVTEANMHNRDSYTVSLLEEVAEFLEDQADVRDGSYGEQVPNRAMSLMAEVELTIERLKRDSLRGPEDEACDLIHQALQQIDYLHQKFQPTGTGEAVMARLDAYLRKRECSSATKENV
jgi:hypothetical protein